MRSLIEDEIYKRPEEIEIPPDGTSLDLLRQVYRANHLPLPTRMRAAMACLPHEAPKLIATAVINESSFPELLERRLKHFAEMERTNKLIEATSTVTKGNGSNGGQVEIKPPLPRLADRRFRRL